MSDPLDAVFVTGEESAKLKHDRDIVALSVYLDRMPTELKPLFREQFERNEARAELASHAPAPTMCEICGEREASTERDGHRFCGYCYGSYAALEYGEEFAQPPAPEVTSAAGHEGM